MARGMQIIQAEAVKHLKEIAAKEGYYAVIRYSGRTSDKNFHKHIKILRENLSEDNVEIIGPSI